LHSSSASGEAHDGGGGGGGHVVGVYLYSVRASDTSPPPLREYSAHARECCTFTWKCSVQLSAVVTWSRVDLHKGQFYDGYIRFYICLFGFSVRRGFLRNWRMNLYKPGVHGSVHRNINLIERTNKMRPCSRIYYSNVS